MIRSAKLYRWFALLLIICLALPQSRGYASPQTDSNLPQKVGNPARMNGAGGGEQDSPQERNDWFYAWREAGDPNVGFTLAQAADLRAQAAQQMISAQNQASKGPQIAPSWSPLGPNPIVQIARSAPNYDYYGVSGRVSALAVRSSPPYTIYLGAAQGGVWASTNSGGWVPLTDNLGSLAIGAIALAPSNENIIYVGTGEGNLSGDSYFGNGVLKSTNAGRTFTHVGGNTFNQVSFSRIAVDPTDPNHVYAAVLSGIGGDKRVSPPFPTPFGIYESTDGGANWTPRLVTNDRHKGATDLVIDPQNPDVLYASFWGEGIVKSTDGGLTWNTLMANGFPTNADYTVAPSRFALGISHPIGDASATLYTGFEWYDTSGHRHASSVWKSTDDGASWNQTSTSVIGDYCGSQCWYDNVIGVDPTNPNIVYALGLFKYGPGTGGVFRSMDGGATWLDLGWDQHPDFHAIAIRTDASNNVVIGSDGGVWSSADYGGRTGVGAPIDAVDWVDMNGTVNPISGAVTTRTGLQITQFNSVAQNPTIPNMIYGGAQDNGTSVRFSASGSWYDVASGDGGQALVDPYSANYVYGTYYDLSPYRFDDGASNFFTNNSIENGINTNDRSEFYVPFAMDPWYTQRLYLGSYRLYRTDNRGSLWAPISGDLTTGCTSRANSPTTFECVITAIGVTAGGPDVYVGTGDGLIWLTTNAYDANPTWVNLTKAPLPQRPISRIAVDSSNYKVAYVTYGGFNAATPFQPGHVFRTDDGGQTWTDISSNLSDIPVNAITIDPVTPSTLYVGTDVGPMVSIDTGATWQPLGSGFPIVATSEISVNPYTGLLRAASYGRGTWELPAAPAAPALQIRKMAADVPVGPSTQLTYNITIRNIGGDTASNAVVTDTIPAHTTYVSSSDGGSLDNGVVTWNVASVPAAEASADGYGSLVPGEVTLTLVVQVDNDQVTGDVITNEQIGLTADGGIDLTGSPEMTTISPANALTLLPASQLDGGHPAEVMKYIETVHNLGYLADQYTLSVGGNQWDTTIWDGTFTSQIATTPSIDPNGTYDIGVQVTIPAGAANASTDTASLDVTSTGNTAITQSATITTRAVSVDILLVDNDAVGGGPDVQPYYRAALDAGHYAYDVWDLEQNPTLPQRFMNAHKAVVWFTGGSYPGPILPYEDNLAAYLDNGGKLFLSGQDLLDQAAGTTSFVQDYLHVSWDGTEAQNDKPITPVLSGVAANPLTAGLGPYTMDFAAVGLDDFSDTLTLIDPAVSAFEDSVGIRALTVSQDNYKVWFLAFPWEAISSADGRLAILQHALTDFEVSPTYSTYLPAIIR